MNTSEHILDNVKEANALIDSDNIHDAVLLSGEALATAYNEWQQKINSCRPSLQEITVMSIAASCHCNALISAGQLHDAYATAIMVILQITVDSNTSAAINQSLLSLYSSALYSLVTFLSNTNPPEDGHAQEHVEAVTRYISSMLYHYYNTVGKESPSCPYLEGAYQGLCYARNLVTIETGYITVNGDRVPPATPNDIVGDIIGRSNALGLLSDS
ncbi:MAG: hypothetical protein IJY31_01735 [Muribaculaceae bacterium]|nr:hypothetical protein [Muribaculaceae bacterium]